MSLQPPRICLFGGTFDPPHIGHLVLAECVRERFGFEHITFLPTGDPPLKTPPEVSASDRLAMLELAVADNPAFRVDPRETMRQGKSYTALTVREYLDEIPGVEMSFIVGADQVAQLNKWDDSAFLFTHVRFIPGLRPPFGQTLWNHAARTLGAERAAQLQLDAVAMPQLEISSTALRERAAKGASLKYLVPDSVRAYIERKKLYDRESLSDRASEANASHEERA